jgi:hypothetical protein
MPSTINTREQLTYDTVRSSSFAKIHGCPTQSDYKNLKKESSDLASKLDDITYDWSRSLTGDKYGLLAKIIGEDEYYHLTNLTWTQEVEPATYDPAINDTTATYTRKQMEQEWECTSKTWAIHKGFLRGVTQISVTHSTKAGTHNLRVSTPPIATQPPSSKHSPNLCNTTMHWQVSPPNHCG